MQALPYCNRSSRIVSEQLMSTPSRLGTPSIVASKSVRIRGYPDIVSDHCSVLVETRTTPVALG